MALLIKTDGTIETVEPKNGHDFTLEELQGYVGGYVEAVYAIRRGNLVLTSKNTSAQGMKLLNIPDDALMIINEEGKLEDLPYNGIATALYENREFDAIVGDVLIVRNVQSTNDAGEPTNFMC